MRSTTSNSKRVKDLRKENLKEKEREGDRKEDIMTETVPKTNQTARSTHYKQTRKQKHETRRQENKKKQDANQPENSRENNKPGDKQNQQAHTKKNKTVIENFGEEHGHKSERHVTEGTTTEHKRHVSSIKGHSLEHNKQPETPEKTTQNSKKQTDLKNSFLQSSQTGRNREPRRTFTLLELLVVLLIIGILAAIAIPSFRTVLGNTSERAATQEMELLTRNIKTIALSNGRNQPTTQDIQTAVEEMRRGNETENNLTFEDASGLTDATSNGTLQGVNTQTTEQLAELTHAGMIVTRHGTNPSACSILVVPLNAAFGEGEPEGDLILVEGSKNANFGGCTGNTTASSEENEEETPEPIFEGIYLATNNTTVMCPLETIGTTGEVNGITYTKRIVEQITPANATTTCTSGITDRNQLFRGATNFNGNISNWNTSNVENMRQLFRGASNFNQDLSNWCTTSVAGPVANFDLDANNWILPRPAWGTCP